MTQRCNAIAEFFHLSSPPTYFINRNFLIKLALMGCLLDIAITMIGMSRHPSCEMNKIVVYLYQNSLWIELSAHFLSYISFVECSIMLNFYLLEKMKPPKLETYLSIFFTTLISIVGFVGALSWFISYEYCLL